MKKTFLAVLALFAVTSSSFAQDIVLKGKELFGDMKARHIGPALMSGRIIDIENHPTNARILYIGTAGGGIWKSNDGAATFSPIFDEHAQSIGVVALDPSDPDNTIWAGTGEIWTRNSVSLGDGLYKSTDAGTTWKKMGFEKSERIASIEINPKNPKEIYVGVMGALWSDSDERGVYKTTDGGETWNKILYVGPSTGAADVLMDPNDPTVLYASMWEFRRTGWGFNSGGETSALYKSTDSGATWNKIQTGFPSGKLGRIGIAIAPSDTNILYAVLETEDPKKNGLWKSTNAGQSWEHLNNDFGLTVRPFYFSRITIDPKDPDVIVKGGLTGSISRDGGKTFQNMGFQHADIHDVVFDIHNSDILYSATDGGLYRSWNGGVTLEMTEDLPLSQFYHISVDDAEPYNVYGGLQDNGSWYGPSSSPGGVEARDWNRVGGGDGFRVLKHKTKPIIYSEPQGAAAVWKYNTEIDKVTDIKPVPENDEELRFNWNTPIALSEFKEDRIYIGSQYVHKSEDMGKNWVKISPDLTTNDPSKQDKESGGLSKDKSGAETHTTIFTIAESPLDENVIWVGTDDGNVQVSKNGGKSWDNVTANLTGIPKNTWVYHIEASVHGKGTAYAVFDGHTSGDMKPYALKTTDYGKTWTNIITDDVKAFARNIQEDYKNENLLFLGTEFGLYITIDGGKNWSHFTNEMPPVAVHFIDMQKKTNDIVMGTHGRGVIILDDISNLREITDDILQKDVHFFSSKEAVMKESGGFGGTSTETQFVGSNPSSVAQITYYLKKRHTFGKMKMEIQDMEGNLVSKLVPGKSKGINIINWNYQGQAPKVAGGKTISFPFAPRAQAGQYKVVLTKGKKTYEHLFKIKNDPKSTTTEAERAQQREALANLSEGMEDLAYLVYNLEEYKKAGEKVLKEKGDVKQVNEVIKKLESLRAELVVTTGDSYVQEAEDELREKMTNLFNDISTSYDAPSKAQLKNIVTYKTQLKEGKEKFEKLKKKEVAKLLKYLEKNEMTSPSLLNREDFLKS
jgi:photosystem II stability/assembly factor-like uncharacterized protein